MATVRFRPAVSTLAIVSLGLLLAACGGGPTATAPQAPSDVVATPGPGYVTVTWKDNSDDETGFEVFRTPAAGLTAQQVAASAGKVGPDVTSFVDMGIEPGQEYSYSVAASNATGSSTPAQASGATVVPVGVDFMVGTNNRANSVDTNGSLFVVYLVFPPEVLEDEALTIEVEFTGPPEWNSGSPLTYACPPGRCTGKEKGYFWVSWHSITAVAGEYTLTATVNGVTYTATASLADAGFKFPRPTDIAVTSATTTDVAATWTHPAGAMSTYLSVFSGNYETLLRTETIGPATSHTISGLELPDGLYTLEVVPLNTDVSGYPLKVADLGLSYASVRFLVGDVIASECASPEEVVTIPDAELLQAVRDALGRPTGDLTCLDMALLTRLEHDNGGITNLAGLQYAVNLSHISLHDNDVADVSPLADLTSLLFLNLNVNEVTDVGPLRNLVNLTDLHLCCTTGNITDVTPLEGMTNMTWFNISNHELGNDVAWQLLQNYPNLRGLWMGNNGLTDFAQVANWPDLEILQVYGSTIPDLTPIIDLSRLHTLEIGWSTIADITPLYGKTELTYLNLDGLDLTDITFLQEFEQLQTLLLAYNQLTTLAPLVANPGIGAGDYVDARNNPLDLTDAAVQADIQALLDRGVNLDY